MIQTYSLSGALNYDTDVFIVWCQSRATAWKGLWKLFTPTSAVAHLVHLAWWHKLAGLKREALILVKRQQWRHVLVHSIFRSCHSAACIQWRRLNKSMIKGTRGEGGSTRPAFHWLWFTEDQTVNRTKIECHLPLRYTTHRLAFHWKVNRRQNCKSWERRGEKLDDQPRW